MTDDMHARIAAIEQMRPVIGDAADDATVAALGLPPPAPSRTSQEPPAAHRRTAPPMQTPHAEAHFTTRDQARIGVAVATNLGTIIYGRDPDAEEQRRLTYYLERLSAHLNQLPLQGLATKLDHQGKGVALSSVYIMLATEYAFSQSCVPVAGESLAALQPFFAEKVHNQLQDFTDTSDLWQALKPEYRVEQTLPHQAILRLETRPIADGRDGRQRLTGLSRAMLVTEAVQQQRQLVLLGAPGSGKSTCVRYLAWALAQRELAMLPDTAMLHGWTAQDRRLPIIVPARRLAQRLATKGVSYTTVVDALCEELMEYRVGHEADLLREALRRNAAMVLFDGLDEVPLTATPGVYADRLTTVQAIRTFATAHPQLALVVTCRIRAFDDALRACLGWHVETLAPFTEGQMRHFARAWYDELVTTGSLHAEQAQRFATTLLTAITDPARPRLREMAATPLLLTMMALVLCNEGELPRDRPLLYEAILKLLLGQWDKVRERQSLAEVIGWQGWGSERIRPVLHQLSYAAHRAAASDDGRGRLAWAALHRALIAHFQEAGMPPDAAAAAAVRCLDYFDQRSGLLLPDGDESYVFAHLTLQEHCAGHYMLLHRAAVQRVLQHRADDRWREPIFLGLGIVQQTNPFLIESVLRALLEREEDAAPKPPARWYRDLILAAEIGQDRDWSYLRQQQVIVSTLQRDLRAGLVALLADPAQPLPTAERVQAGFLLGVLGDPRLPVTADQWRRELSHGTHPFGQPTGYWCVVRPATYPIGGWDKDEPVARISLQAFWIARYPLTVAQYAPFVAVGYAPAAERWWPPQGWQWKNGVNRTAPWRWNDAQYQHPNQALIGLTWYEAMAFARWLTEQLAEMLPVGYRVRLPTEAEWEAAAAFGDDGKRRPYPWGTDAPTPERANYEDTGLGRPAPVGCFPAGAAACGALDLAGQVWEWTCSSYAGYPAQSGPAGAQVDAQSIEDHISLRGSSYYTCRTYVRCGARIRLNPGGSVGYYGGCRLVLAPHTL